MFKNEVDFHTLVNGIFKVMFSKSLAYKMFKNEIDFHTLVNGIFKVMFSFEWSSTRQTDVFTAKKCIVLVHIKLRDTAGDRSPDHLKYAKWSSDV